MSSVEAHPAPTTTSNAPSNQRRRWRGPRRGGTQFQSQRSGPPNDLSGQTVTNDDGHNVPARDLSLLLRPASVGPCSQPTSTEPSSAEVSAVENSPRAGRRGGAARRGARGSRPDAERHGVRGQAIEGARQTNGAGTPPNHTLNAPMRRQFQGRLTEDAEHSVSHTERLSPAETQLQPDAPEFRPGQQHHLRNRQPRGGKQGPPQVRHQQRAVPRPRRASSLKSKAADIATRTHEDISNNLYECPICTSEIGRQSKVWSCKTCWTVFHLSCITKWSANEGAVAAQQQIQNGNIPPPRQWRCPGCNLPKDGLPSLYTCWCEKEMEPRSISGIPPHSCGQTCGKHRILPKKCPHPCELLCHAGPCPPCTHKGPVQSCYCGKKSTSRRCVETNYDTGWSCGQICGDPMPCGEHTCQRPCHEGLCGACEVEIDGRCYCGKVQQMMPCCDRGQEKRSQKDYSNRDGEKRHEQWTGLFQCANACNRPFDCGKHHCEQGCHPQTIDAANCPRSPHLVSHCPCGKTPLREISVAERESCEAPIPNCDKRCLKQLECGHACQATCHSGQCMPCFTKVQIGCRCGRVQSSTICHQGREEQPQCVRVCKVTLNCGRHECGERCCPAERKAVERQALKRKLRPLGAPRITENGFEAEHICTRTCGRLLKCGNHECPELCHKGPCGTCREAIFEDISCHCGKTTLQPPLPCGTSPPPCRFDCERPTTCGHSRIPHNCHGDEELCPKCPFLIEKPCMCGKKRLKNQPCWLADVRCGEVCGKKVKCGSHLCRKPCHRAGECEDAGKLCQQSCGKAKKACGHPCQEKCHAPSSCREDKPCQNKMLITCDCQHLKQEIKCNASKTSEGNSKKTLTCDDECARLARNQRLALALNIDPEAHKDDHIPYSSDTLKMFRESVKWAQAQEREFRVFAADESEKRLRFKPMPSHQRAFLHSLSEDFGFDSESMDPEPHRHVAVFKTPRFVREPMKTLSECVRIRATADAAASSASALSESQRNLLSNNAPLNGFLLTRPRFGLTIEELRSDILSTLETASSLIFDINFLPSEEIVIKARPASSSLTISGDAIANVLRSLKPALAAILSSKRPPLAHSIHLCALDPSLNIVRKEADLSTGPDSDGWSQVAAKAAAPRTAPRQMAVGERSVYTVLGSKLRDAKKKKEEEKKAKELEPVVDDWEMEAGREEEGLKDRISAENNINGVDSVEGGAIREGGSGLVGAYDQKSDAPKERQKTWTAHASQPPRK